jgi:hypothetical protein
MRSISQPIQLHMNCASFLLACSWKFLESTCCCFLCFPMEGDSPNVAWKAGVLKVAGKDILAKAFGQAGQRDQAVCSGEANQVSSTEQLMG